MAARALAPLAAAALLLSGLACGGKVPPTTVWSLPVPGEQSPGVDPGGPALGVARFTADATLRTTALTWREGDGRRIQRYGYQQWADYPDHMLREMLLRELLSSREYSAVTTSPPRAGLDGLLECRLVEFDEWDRPEGVTVTVAVRWSLSDENGELLAAELSRAQRRAGAKTVEAVVEAFAGASEAVVSEMARRVREALEVPRGS